jgi:dihydrofolate reductase
MGKLGVFNFVTLNGFYKGANNDISWHSHGSGEESSFAEEGAQSGGTLLFGRVTYEMMAAWWPTDEAIKTMPVIADGMNKAEKIVFSTTLKKSDWNNTTIVKDNMAETVSKMKKAGKNMTILGSGSIVSQLAEHGLIDDYQFMVDPVALGQGTSIFHGIKQPLKLDLIATRIFKSGVLLLTYRPSKK